MSQYLTAQEERRLVRLGQRGDHDARNKVIMNIANLIHKVMGKYRKVLRNHYYDAFNFIIFTLCDKFHKFELRRNLRFVTYAHWWIKQSLQNYVDNMSVVHIPTYLLRPENKHTERVEKYGKYVDKAKKVKTIEPQAHESYMRYQEQFISKEPGPDYYSEHQDDLDKLRRIMSNLEEREQIVLTRRSHGETLDAIAGDYGVTKERVRQIEFNALKKLRKLAEAVQPCQS